MNECELNDSVLYPQFQCPDSGRSRAHLTVSTERVLFQTNKSCLCKSISPFTMGLYGSPYDYVARVANY